MSSIQRTTQYAIQIGNGSGTYIQKNPLNYISLHYTQVVNDVGAISIITSDDLPKSCLTDGNIIEVHRKPVGGGPTVDGSYFLTGWTYTEKADKTRTLELTGRSFEYLLKNRIITQVGINEVQRLVITGGATGGNFTITYSGQTTANIAATATKETVQTELGKLSNIGSGNVSVAKPAGVTWDITFQHTLGNTDVAMLTATNVSLSGGSGYGFSINETTKGGSAMVTGTADNVMKSYVRNNLLAGLDGLWPANAAARNLTSAGLTCEANTSKGATLSFQGENRNLLAALQDIAKANLQALGTPQFFGIVQTGYGSNLALQFCTFSNQRGADRTTTTGVNPIILSVEATTLAAGSVSNDYADSVNSVRVGGPGNGALRSVTEVDDTNLEHKSPWSRREAFLDDQSKTDAAARTADGNAILFAGRPKINPTVTLAPNGDKLTYGKDYHFGDSVTADVGGQRFPVRIDGIDIQADNQGNEQISATLTYGTVGYAHV